MGYDKSTIYNDCTTVQEQKAAMEYKKSAMLDKRSTIYNDYTTVQEWGIKNQPFLITAPLCKNKKSAIGYKKSAMLDKSSTIYNDCTTGQEQKVSHGV